MVPVNAPTPTDLRTLNERGDLWPSPQHSSVQVTNTASTAPAASLRDQLRRPLTRRPLPRDSAPIGEMAGTRSRAGTQEEAALPTCHYRAISTGREGYVGVTRDQAVAQLSARLPPDHGDMQAGARLLPKAVANTLHTPTHMEHRPRGMAR